MPGPNSSGFSGMALSDVLPHPRPFLKVSIKSETLSRVGLPYSFNRNLGFGDPSPLGWILIPYLLLNPNAPRLPHNSCDGTLGYITSKTLTLGLAMTLSTPRRVVDRSSKPP